MQNANRTHFLLSILMIFSFLLSSCGAAEQYDKVLDPVPPPPAYIFRPFDTKPYYSPAGAQAWYIDSVNGKDSADGRSPATAWKTLSRAHSLVLGPGQVLRLARGSVWVNESLFFDNGSGGVAGNPAYVEAYGTGNKPLIKSPRALWNSNLEWPAISFGRNTGSTIAAKHFNILDIRVQFAKATAISMSMDSSFIIVAGCEISQSGAGVGIAGEDQKVLGCWVHDGVMAVDTGVPDKDWGAVGVGIVGKRIEIAWNYLSDCIAESRSFGTDGSGIEFFGYDADGLKWEYVSEDIYIHHNYIRNADCFMEAMGKVNRMVIAYNAYVESPNDAFIFHLNSMRDDIYYKNVLIANNTLINNVPDRNGWGVFGLLVNWNKKDAVILAQSNFVIKNNLVQTNHYALSWINPVGNNLSHDYNHFSFINGGAFCQNAGVWTKTAHETEGVADFYDSGVSDYRLVNTSPGSTGCDSITSPLFTTLWDSDLSGQIISSPAFRSRGAWQAVSAP
ncbi:MAG TPA: hypothetical protein PK624_11420 [Spirochaetota bacterium]|nr:hypothetical protein [Spirochaetota bacterium]